MKSKKALVVLTSFWDAEILIRNKYFVFKHEDNGYRGLIDKDTYSLFSIALSNPPFTKFKHIKDMERLWFWCPTYNMLRDYQEDKDWDKYTVRYKELIRSRKEDIKEWIDSLVPNHIYILCCWENTSKNSHCHRQLIYDALLSSKTAKEKIFPVYRDGSNKREGENEIEKKPEPEINTWADTAVWATLPPMPPPYSDDNLPF